METLDTIDLGRESAKSNASQLKRIVVVERVSIVANGIRSMNTGYWKKSVLTELFLASIVFLGS